MSFLGKALSEDNGNPSSTRLNVFISLTQWALGITFGFVWVVIYHPDLTIAYLSILATLTAGLLGLKVFQKGKEEGSDAKPKDDTKTP